MWSKIKFFKLILLIYVIRVSMMDKAILVWYPFFAFKGRTSIIDIMLSVSSLLSGSRLDQLLDIFRQLKISMCSRATIYRENVLIILQLFIKVFYKFF